MILTVRTLVGENAMTLEDGEAMYGEISEPLKRGERVVLDFEGVNVFASPFFNAAIGRLLGDLEPEALNQALVIEHLVPYGERLLRRVIANARDYYSEPPERRAEIDQAVENGAVAA